MTAFLTYYLAFAGCVLALVATGIFPRTKWSSDGSLNNLGRVHMMPAAYYTETNQSMLGVYAQERVECFMRWFMFLTVVGAFLSMTRFYDRQSEFIGHASEIVAAKGFDRETYLHDEAERTYRSSAYDGLFDHLDLEGMKRALRRRFWIARILVFVNGIAIARMP